MRARNHRKMISDDTNRWLLSYADFITLMFAFFVVMYAVSNLNMAKYQKLSKGVSKAFNQPVSALAKQSNANVPTGNDLSDTQYPVAKQGSSPLAKGHNQITPVLESLVDGSAISLHHGMKGWLELEIKAGGLFETGGATLTPSAKQSLLKIADALTRQNGLISIEGYTDNVPIKNSRFASNWELSAARAASVARFLSQHNVDPRRLSATGYGEQFPVADNKTKQGRMENRRVMIVITNDKKTDRLLTPLNSSVVRQFEDLRILEEVSKASQIINGLLGKTVLESSQSLTKEVQALPGKIKQIKTQGGGVKYTRQLETSKSEGGE